MSKMYIAVLDEFPCYMVPTLVAHTVLGAHKKFTHLNDIDDIVDKGVYVFPEYVNWCQQRVMLKH